MEHFRDYKDQNFDKGKNKDFKKALKINTGFSLSKYIKSQNLAKLLAYLFTGLRSTSSGLAILFLLRGLFSFYLQVSIASSICIAAPLALIVAISSFALYVSVLEKRIFDFLNSEIFTGDVTENNAAIEQYHAAYPGQLNSLIKIRQATAYFISVLAPFIEGAAVFYSSTKVLNTILMMSSVLPTTQLFPMIVPIGVILAFGAIVASLGVTSFAIRKLLGYKSDSKNTYVKVRKYQKRLEEYKEVHIRESYNNEVDKGFIVLNKKVLNCQVTKNNKVAEDEKTEVRNEDFGNVNCIVN